MTPLIVLLTSCLPAIWVLNSLPMSSIFAFAAIFLALSVRFLKMIWKKMGKGENCGKLIGKMRSLLFYQLLVAVRWSSP